MVVSANCNRLATTGSTIERTVLLMDGCRESYGGEPLLA
ncbi:hypothetical protein HSB1_47980 [Halogranum salarium B-1]|uniref:Uncharacterized protein n=1 Tax=Halogranum salarium B-1 TaxID=1210908 RepID=J3JCW9_9EURY|nr:hypothetical protein HSB1_47980 [Halogranum salarium B-1]